MMVLEDKFGGVATFQRAELLRVIVIGEDARMAVGRMASLETTLDKVYQVEDPSIFVGVRKVNCPETYW